MAAHVLRLPRLTLKAGRKAGCKAGSPRDRRASNRNEMQKSKFAKFEISKIANLKNQNLEKLSSQFFPRDRSRNYLLEIAFLFLRSATRHSLLRLLVLHWQCASCILNASKQCPYEATTSTRLNSHGSEQRTQEDTMNPMRRSPSLLVEI